MWRCIGSHLCQWIQTCDQKGCQPSTMLCRGRRALDGRLSAPSGTGNGQQPPPPLLSSPPRPTDPISNLKLPSSSSISVQRSGESFLPFLCRRAAIAAAVGRTFLTNQSEGGSDSRSERVRLRIKFHNGFLPLRNLCAPEKKERKKQARTQATDGGRWLIASWRRRPPSVNPVVPPRRH